MQQLFSMYAGSAKPLTRREKWTVKHLDSGHIEQFTQKEEAKSYCLMADGPVSLRRPHYHNGS